MFQARLSTEREVVLDNVDFTTTGQYRCEVSGDAPMFQTASTEGILYVVGEYLSFNKESEVICMIPISVILAIEFPFEIINLLLNSVREPFHSLSPLWYVIFEIAFIKALDIIDN